MKEAGNVFERLKARGEEVFTQLSGELMSNPNFVKAMQAAMKGKAKLDQGVGRALKQMNIPTRTEFKRAVRRVEGLEGELAALKEKLVKLEKQAKAPKAKAAPRAAARPRAGRKTIPAAPAGDAGQ